MSIYKPKYTDPRVIKRINTAIKFVEHYVSTNSVSIAQSQIYKHLGRTDTAIGNFLKEQLLICTDEYYNWETHVCKKYILNESGLNNLKTQLKYKTDITVEPELQLQLDTGEFEYKDLSSRLFNPLQYIPRRVKRDLLTLNNYRHNYDIEAAAPTLLYQYAQKQGLDIPLVHLEQYISRRTEIRNDLSIKYNIPVNDIKTLINGLVQGAYLSHSHTSRIYHLLKGNHNKINQLKSDVFLTQLREDIKMLWKYISPVMKQELNKKRLNGRDKASKYRELERLVMDVIKRELKRNKNKFLLQHDGWTSRDVVDIRYMRDVVRSSTGYVINIDWEIWE